MSKYADEMKYIADTVNAEKLKIRLSTALDIIKKEAENGKYSVVLYVNDGEDISSLVDLGFEVRIMQMETTIISDPFNKKSIIKIGVYWDGKETK